ncbi:Ig-like domain-containing protein [Fulvivirga sp. M361]|uniref:Ig-like domain-containing protein n=1 Tax=Fulvivirga sp. M361 TaxID=2594266 RepID=UPI001624D6CA|nr:Ig-like domain-containing protein [Fulvivirga sp. M361]
MIFIISGVIVSPGYTQLQIADPGISIDQEKIAANQDNYPQMECWAQAGVRGGIPFLNSFSTTKIIEAGTSADINAALTELNASLKDGEMGLLILRNGEYDLQSEVTMKSNVSILGETRDGVVCTINFLDGFGFHFRDGVEKSGMYRLTIQGGWGEPKYDWNYSIPENDEMPNNGNISVKFTRSTDCWLDKINIYNSGRDPMRCDASHTTFRDLKVKGAHRKAGGAQGYFFIQDGDNLITGCEMTHLRHISLQGGGVEYNVVYDNDFYQEVSFHTGDDGNNLIEANRITLPEDMPPVESGGPYLETNTNAPNYFAIMGPWSIIHEVSANPNFLFNNRCLQLNHDFGSKTPWSDPNKVYSGPIKIGRNPDDHINNFPVLADNAPVGNTLYAISGANPPAVSGLNKSPKVQFLQPLDTEIRQGSIMLVELDVEDDFGVGQVSLYVDDVPIGTRTDAPFIWHDESILNGLDMGSHQLRAVVIDDDGLETERLMNFEITDSSNAPSQYTETFSNMVLDGWGTETFQGDDNWIWNVNGKGINGDIEGRGVYFHKQVTGITSSTFQGGITRLSVECLNKFNGNERTVELYVNDALVKTHTQTGQDQKYTVDVDDLNIEGDFSIQIRNASSTSDPDDRRTVSFDNISWTTLGNAQNAAPVLSFGTPIKGKSLQENELLEVEVFAYDDENIAKVELFLNDQLISADNEAPYFWGTDVVGLQNLVKGDNILKAIAYDNESLSSQRQVTVFYAVNEAPVIRFISPVNGAKMKSITSVDIEVTDDIGLSKTELYLNDQLISTKSDAPFGWSPSETFEELSSLTQDTYMIKVMAEDVSGKRTESQIIVTLNEPPTINVISPTSGSVFDNGSAINLNISVMDDFSEIKQVELFLDDVLIDEKTTAPFSWDSQDQLTALLALEPGVYTLKVIATDLEELSSTASVVFEVNRVILGNETLNKDVLVFPNPVDNVLRIQASGSAPFQFVLYDVFGKELVRSSTEGLETNINMSVYKPGLYYLHLTNSVVDKTFKVFRKN